MIEKDKNNKNSMCKRGYDYPLHIPFLLLWDIYWISLISETYEKELIQKRTVFAEVTKTKCAVHTIMVLTNGIAHNAYSHEIQNEVSLNDLFL